MKLKILNPELTRLYGDEVDIETDKHGTPTEKYWRNRLRDATRDKCVEVVIEVKGKTKKGDK